MLKGVCYNISMSKILIIGNVLKDVYLKLDERQNDFEVDERGINWLELGFNGDAHKFFHRTSVFGGAAVSLSVLKQLGIEGTILNSRTEIKAGELTWSDDPADYRYILSCRGGITYFVPAERKPTDWAMPKGTPEWILVDRSTNVSNRLVDELKNFLKFSHGTKLAVHSEKHTTPAGQKLIEMADVLFIEDEAPVHREEKIVDKIEVDQPNTQLVCHISPRKLSLGGAEESWNLDRADMMTHLTVYSTIVATVLGVIAVGGTASDALLWAKINAENATLNGSLAADKLRELAERELAKRSSLKLIARSLLNPGKGILALDEGKASLVRRFEKFGIVSDSQNQQDFYQIMLTTPGLQDYISGVILSDKLSRQQLSNGRSVLEFLTSRGVISGIKVDLGLTSTMDPREKWTQNHPGLAEELRQSYERGFRFAKCRAAFQVSEKEPDFFVVERNTTKLATFAKEAQLAGLVPMVEIDVATAGDYTIEKCAEVKARLLAKLFERLAERQVSLNGCILKCGMVRSGNKAEVATSAHEIGVATAAILKHAVPRYMAGVVLLSGGQEPKIATKNLTAIMQESPFPWPVSFAFSRALEEPVLATWKGDNANIKAAQAALGRHLAANADALHYLQVEPRGGASSADQIGVLDWN